MFALFTAILPTFSNSFVTCHSCCTPTPRKQVFFLLFYFCRITCDLFSSLLIFSLLNALLTTYVDGPHSLQERIKERNVIGLIIISITYNRGGQTFLLAGQILKIFYIAGWRGACGPRAALWPCLTYNIKIVF